MSPTDEDSQSKTQYQDSLERPHHPLDQSLDDLWFRRLELNEAEWNKLYAIVVKVLRPYRPKEFSGLREASRDLVDDFFEDKVFLPDSSPSRVHVGALMKYYRNYLLQRIARDKTRIGHIDTNTQISDDGRELVREGSSDPDMQIEASPDNGFGELEEIGWTIDRLGKSARKWLDAQERWVRIYLALNFAPDHEDKMPLRDLAERYGIRNYHSKAVRLGINWDSSLVGNAGKSFADTIIGKWIAHDLEIKVVSDNMGMVHAALKILSREALTWSEAQESSL